MSRKWLVVLPNLFTISSIFCGLYAIILATGVHEGTSSMEASSTFFRAAMAILLGAFFDGCDGRVARLTRTQTEFGVQLDSLADVISFGVAPALLLYKLALAPLGLFGIAVAGVYVACGAMRLARFNVMSAEQSGPSNYFTGLPIPLAAAMVVAVVVAATRASQGVEAVPAAVLTLVLSYLMVSNIHYRSFKKVQLKASSLAVVAGLVLFGVVVATQVRPSMVLLAYASGYILLGLVEEIVFRRRRTRALELAGTSPSVVVLDDDEDA